MIKYAIMVIIMDKVNKMGIKNKLYVLIIIHCVTKK